MSKAGQIERITQNRVVQLFKNQLHYEYLGNWEERDNNSNSEECELRKYIQGKYSEELITKAIFALKKEATISINENLYTANKEVYTMLRYSRAKK